MGRKVNRMRHIVRTLHLWLGLSVGSLFVLLGLSGSILVFYPDIDRLLNPEIRVEVKSPPDFDAAWATVLANWPDKAGPWRFEVTGNREAIPARYNNPAERKGHDFRPMMVWLSPDGAQVLRRDYWGEYAMTFIYDLHYRLLLGEIGGTVLGWTGFALLALLMSGLWAWWPRGSWTKALRVRAHAPPVRRWRDWHKLSGLSGLLFLVILTTTGIMLELPEETDAALTALRLPVDTLPIVAPVVPSSSGQINISQAITVARKAFPTARLAWIETPPKKGGTFRLRYQVAGDPSRRFPHSFVWIDSFSGEIRAVQDARQASAGSLINNWVHPLHDGSAAGLAGRILVALCGILPLALFLTGLLRWRARRSHSRSPLWRSDL
jgi:uncharacterized iron-regulated membrane protein